MNKSTFKQRLEDKGHDFSYMTDEVKEVNLFGYS